MDSDLHFNTLFKTDYITESFAFIFTMLHYSNSAFTGLSKACKAAKTKHREAEFKLI